MQKSDLFWGTYLNLEKEVLTLSQYISFTDTTIKIKQGADTRVLNWGELLEYSANLTSLFLQCCAEIKTISKELYSDNGGTKQRENENLQYDTDCLAFLNDKWNLSDKKVSLIATNFNNNEKWIFRPLYEAHITSNQGWIMGYQPIKDDRYNSIFLINIKSVLHALAALYLLNKCYEEIDLYDPIKDASEPKKSLVSEIFSLENP